MSQCPSDNAEALDQSTFWDSNGINWDPHRIGWAIAGGCAVLTFVISSISIISHCRSYTNRGQQRQIIRILLMPPIYAIISFFSYRYFRDYVYYSFVQAAYEAVTLSAFLLLLVEYFAATASGHSTDMALQRKDKRPLPIPFCCWRYRPTKAYFMYTVKWAVLQYVIIRPSVSIAGIICEKLNVLCHSLGYNFKHASVYLDGINFISISVALYGLLIFYGLTAEELKGRRPLAKFLAIKLIVMFTFYQAFVINALQGHVIKATQYWTATNISNGLNALTICVEMVFFSILMFWAYSASEYKQKDAPATSIWRPLWDSINYTDFIFEIAGSLRFFINSIRGKSTVQGHGHRTEKNQYGQPKLEFGDAFGLTQRRSVVQTQSLGMPHVPMRSSYDENIRLAPYPYTPTEGSVTDLR